MYGVKIGLIENQIQTKINQGLIWFDFVLWDNKLFKAKSS